jgi:hypothetical protein
MSLLPRATLHSDSEQLLPVKEPILKDIALVGSAAEHSHGHYDGGMAILNLKKFKGLGGGQFSFLIVHEGEAANYP